MIKIKSKNKPKSPRRFYYVCNRQKCADCIPDCKWTTDINYALYETHDHFETGLDNTMWEVIRGKA